MTREEIIDQYHAKLRAIRDDVVWSLRKQNKNFLNVLWFFNGDEHADNEKHHLPGRTGT